MARALVIEDHSEVRLVFRHMLEELGYEVELAATVVEGIELLLSRPWDFVLVDLMLPDGDGLDVYARASSVGVPCGLMTGDLTQVWAGEVNGVPALAKPFKLQALSDFLASLTAGRDQP